MVDVIVLVLIMTLERIRRNLGSWIRGGGGNFPPNLFMKEKYGKSKKKNF